MRRLEGKDANFLYQETPTALMHTLKIHIINAPQQEMRLQQIRDGLSALLHRVPMLRRRVVYIPFGFHHPVYIEDPDFNLESHIFRAAIPAPGTMVELEEMIAQIAGQRLDRTRPLWEMWILEGLEGGRMAIVHKIHHCMADGMASVGFITRMWGEKLVPGEGTNGWQPEPLPSPYRLLWDALVDHVKYDARNFPKMVKTLRLAIRNMSAHSKVAHAPAVEAITGTLPRLPWNRALSNNRAFATAQVSLQDARALKAQLGGTVNDVLLALAASTVREYLLSIDQLPDTSLLIAIPVAVDDAGVIRESGNNTASVMTMLKIEIADPLERYYAIQKVTEAGKKELDVMGKYTYNTVMQYIPPGLLGWYRRREFRKRGADAPDYKVQTNMTVSNVPGPKDRLMGLGGGMLDLYSIGPLIEGNGLNITVWSYAGNLNFSVMACRKAVPDVRPIAEGIPRAFRELQEAAAARTESVQSVATGETASTDNQQSSNANERLQSAG